MLTARDSRLGPRRRPRLRGGRLPRQAVRDRGARGAGAGAGPAGPRRRRPQTTLGTGPIQLDEATRIVTVDGLRVDLSPREFALLECLLRHRGRVLSRDQLLDHAWPYDAEVTPGDRRHLRLLPAAQAGPGRAAARSRPCAAWATGRRHERRDDDRAPRPARVDARGAGPPPHAAAAHRVERRQHVRRPGGPRRRDLRRGRVQPRGDRRGAARGAGRGDDQRRVPGPARPVPASGCSR